MAEILKEITIVKNGVPKTFTIPDNTEEVAEIKQELANKANTNHTHTGYASENHSHTEFYTKEEMEEKLAGIQTGGGGTTNLENYCTKAEAAEKFAPRTHTHTEFARVNHTHTGFASENHTHSEFALKNHTHIDFANREHDHNESYYTKSEVDRKVADIPQGGTVDLSSYYNKQEVYNKTEIDTKFADIPQGGTGTQTPNLDNYYTKQEADNGFAEKTHTHTGYAPTNHNHDSSYYTKSEIDTKIASIHGGGGLDTTTLHGILNNSNRDVTIYVGGGSDNTKTHGLSADAPLTSIEYILNEIPKNLNGRTITIKADSLDYMPLEIDISGFVGGEIVISSDTNTTIHVRDITIKNCTKITLSGLQLSPWMSKKIMNVDNCSYIGFFDCGLDVAIRLRNSRVIISSCTFLENEFIALFNSDVSIASCTETTNAIKIDASTLRLGSGNSGTIINTNYHNISNGGQVLT